MNSNSKERLSPESPDSSEKGISKGISLAKKDIRKLDILKIFSPRKYVVLAYRQYSEKKAIGRSYFYRIVNELEDEKYLIHVGGRSPREMEVANKGIERLSLLLGIPTSKGNMPRTEDQISALPVQQPRLHNILFVVPIFCPNSWYNAEMKKEGWNINFQAGNLKNVTKNLDSLNATIQFFRQNILIRLREVQGSNVYVNASIALDQFDAVIDELEVRLPQITFYRDLRKYETITKNPPMMYFENGLPGHPIPIVERKKGIKTKTVFYNNGKSKLFSDNSVGPELDFIGENSNKDTQKCYDDLIYTFETGVGVPEIHESQLDHSMVLGKINSTITEMVEIQSRTTEHTLKNKEILEEIQFQKQRDLEAELMDLKQKINQFENKESLFQKIRRIIHV